VGAVGSVCMYGTQTYRADTDKTTSPLVTTKAKLPDTLAELPLDTNQRLQVTVSLASSAMKPFTVRVRGMALCAPALRCDSALKLPQHESRTKKPFGRRARGGRKQPKASPN